MKRMLLNKAIVPIAAIATTVGVARTASAADCSTLPAPLYITGSSAVKPYIAALGKALAGTTTLVYLSQGSCNGVDAIFNGTMLMAGAMADTWDNTGTDVKCSIPAGGISADIGVSDVYSSSCAGFSTPPAGIGEFFGPNQVMNFIVPTASSQTSISAEAAYMVYGFGGASNMVAPWTTKAFLFQRDQTSGTQSMIAAAIGVPPAKWLGTTVTPNSSAGMFATVAHSTMPEATIGIVASDIADGNVLDPTTMMMTAGRTVLKILAYQHYKQDCAWLPDSSSTSFDKINVRDGHYPIWGPIHFYTKVTGMVPTNPAVATFLGYFPTPPTSMPPAGVNMLKLAIGAHTVPSCAMHVKRSTEVGPVSSFKSTAPCDCYFEQIANGSTMCTACTMANDPKCTGNTQCTVYDSTATPAVGYCEAK
jgi:ABC-type phosphate transport system substrate-binding protein